LRDLHHGKANNEIMYIQKMSLAASNGGLWGDFTAIYWISQYLQQSIYVWNKNNGQIMVKVGDNMNGITLNIVYGNDHFEHVKLYDPTISLQSSNNVLQSSLNNQHIMVLKQHVCLKPKNETIRFDFVNRNYIITKQHHSRKSIIVGKQKRFVWNFELDKQLLKIQTINPTWKPQEIGMAFIYGHPMWNLNTLQIKYHLKYL